MKYKFYVGWFSGSDGNCGEENGVYKPEDLPTAFENEASGVSCYDIEAPNDEVARLIGESKAFHENFTACDSVTHLEKVGCPECGSMGNLDAIHFDGEKYQIQCKDCGTVFWD